MSPLNSLQLLWVSLKSLQRKLYCNQTSKIRYSTVVSFPYVYWTMHHLDSWIETNLISLALLFHYLMLNMFRMLIHLSSGTCDLFVDLFHGLYCSGSMCVGVMLWFGWCGVVSWCWPKFQPTSGNHISCQLWWFQWRFWFVPSVPGEQKLGVLFY